MKKKVLFVSDTAFHDMKTQRAIERGSAEETLARAKRMEQELMAAGKLERIETTRGTFWACGRYIDAIRNHDFTKIDPKW